MTIMEDGLRLDARLDMPQGGKGPCPLVIVIHGFTGYKEEEHLNAVCDAMNEMGFATLRADMYGHGKSDGEFRKHTLYRWLTNVLTVYNYARGLDFVTDIYLCGHSQGGLTAMLAGGMLRDVVSGLILLAPASMIPEIARRGELLGQSFDPDHIPQSLAAWDGRALDGDYIRVAQTIRVEDAVSRFRGPVLLVHGDADESVDVRCSIDAAEQYGDAKLVIIPGDTHCFDNHLDRVVDAVKDWLGKRA